MPLLLRFSLRLSHTHTLNAASLIHSQGNAASASASASANGSGAVSQGNGKGIFTVTDSVDQPKLKGQGRMKRTRFSIRRQLQKHGLAHADSDSDLENEESERLVYLFKRCVKYQRSERRTLMFVITNIEDYWRWDVGGLHLITVILVTRVSSYFLRYLSGVKIFSFLFQNITKHNVSKPVSFIKQT